MAINFEYFKNKLESEKSLIEKELNQVGQINPDNPNDWEPVPPKDRDTSFADEGLNADVIEEYEANAAITQTLEERLNKVKDALQKIEDQTYGNCKICGAMIEEERLEANPSATTCITHINAS